MVHACHTRLHKIKYLASSFGRGVGGIELDCSPLNRETRGGRQCRGGREAFVDEQVDTFTSSYKRPAGACETISH
jgi:hypothetical protein